MVTEESLWGDAFPVDDTEKTEKILKKIKNPKTVKVKKDKELSKLSFEEKLPIITERVKKILGQHASETILLTTKEELDDYVQKAIATGFISIDTETNNSKDPFTCKIMGGCLYAPGLKQAYIPINHVDYRTGERLKNQLTEKEFNESLSVLTDKTKAIYQNAPFDLKVVWCTCGLRLPFYWDTMIACRLLDENEGHGLKEQYMLHVDPNHGKYDIEDLFDGEDFAKFPPELFALYAATDAMMTFKLYEYQIKELTKPENKNLYKLTMEVEMPCIPVVTDMELRGVAVDTDYAKRIGVKYHKMMDEYSGKIDTEVKNLMPKINAWKASPAGKEMSGKKTKAEQLTDPININSSTQLGIIIYDVLGVPTTYNTKGKPRSVDKNTLPLILEDYDIPLVQLIVDSKAFQTLIDNFIDKIPASISPRDGRIHSDFDQLGTVTGRFSSSGSINLQQIPSHNHEVRLMFKASDGCLLVGSDYSQQEVRVFANYCKDENMIEAYKENKDLYATIASKVYHNNYEDNLEFDKNGNRSEQGAKRRTSVKSLLLGILYGMSIKGIANKLKCSKEEAEGILNGLYKEFPKIKQWTNETEDFAKKHGYVEDFYGRRRRLPELLLPAYTIKPRGDDDSSFNPILGCGDKQVDKELEDKYLRLLAKTKYYRDVQDIKAQASLEGIDIVSNMGAINKALRQCVNARVQGGAATMTKMAMNKIYRDPELNKLDFHLLIGVHDELIGECPKENAEEAAKRLTEVMKTCMDGYSVVNFKCDASIVSNWYGDVYKSSLEDEMKEFEKKGLTKDESLARIIAEHTESTEEQLRKILA